MLESSDDAVVTKILQFGDKAGFTLETHTHTRNKCEQS